MISTRDWPMISKSDIYFVPNLAARDNPPERASTVGFDQAIARRVRSFHSSLPGYSPSPLIALDALAADLGVSNVWVKDESKRFGLNAFKVLGAGYGVVLAVADSTGLDAADLSPGTIDDPAVRSRVEQITVCTATDGNHGRAVAWAAQRLGCKSVVYMPRGTARARKQAVASHGADVSVLDCAYDEAVKQAALDSDHNGWLLVQDTSWPGYEAVPQRIMQGYLTILDEAMDQLHGQIPTHVLVQAGVGSLAAAIQAQLVELLGAGRPVLAVVEPTQSACCYASFAANSGDPVSLPGAGTTIMAGLACGTPSTIAWNILRDYADAFVVCSDKVAELGMRILAKPCPGDQALVSGESGAVTAGLLVSVLSPASRATFADAFEVLMLDVDSRVLLLSTEGDTDPDSYKRIVTP
jgi:diaminopropionate ammonia-lyase